ncbi:MAG: antibiotic biosynthesis monooxygenase [Leptolinea sp.]
MYLTTLNGHVKKENRRTLEESYAKKAKHPPEGLLQSFLIHDKEDKSDWQIISVWRNEEAYIAAKAGGLADTCEDLFCDAGATPERRHYDVAERFIRIASE